MAESSAIVRLAMIGRGPFVRDAKAAERSLDGIANKARNVDVSGNFATMTGAMVTSRVALGGLTVAAGGLALALGAPLIASAGAAALAIGALGVAAGGVFVAGMALAAGVAARYADTAHIAGSAANELRGALGGLQTAANRAISPGAANVMRGLADAAKTVTPVVASLRGAFATFGTAAGEAVRIVANGVAQLGPELRLMVGQAGRVLTALAPAVAPFLRILFNVTNAAMPHLVRLAEGFTRTVQGWSSAVAGADLGGIFGAAVGHLRSWVSLASGVVRILVGIGAALAPMGGGWVASLAAGADRLADFVASARGVAAVRGVFGTIMGVVGGVARVIGMLAVVAWNAGKQLLAAFAPAMPFLQNVLLPLLKGVALGVMGGIVAAFKLAVPVIGFFARMLGRLGTWARPLRGVFSGIGTVLGFLLGGPILKLLGALPKLGGVFRLLAVPIKFVGKVIGGLVGIAGKVVGFLASKFGPAFSRVFGSIQKAVGKLRDVFSGIGTLVGSVFGGIVDTIRTALNGVIGTINTAIGAFNALPGPNIGKIGEIGGGGGDTGGLQRSSSGVGGGDSASGGTGGASNPARSAPMARQSMASQMPPTGAPTPARSARAMAPQLLAPRREDIVVNLTTRLGERDVHTAVHRVERNLAEQS